MASAGPSQRYRFGPFELQRDERRLLKDGETVALRPQALEVLWALIDRAGHLLTKDELMQRVWGQVIVEENTLQAHVSALRKVLGPDAIATVSGQGYRLTLEVVRVPEASSSPVPAHNLPQQLTSFVGRSKEIAQITQLLSSTRLLTLAGAGGCGKTRLALQVAASAVDHYPEGVRLVELGPLSDSTLIVQALAKALAIEEQPGKDLAETLVGWLGSQRLLLLLDNAEHVLDACARLADSLLRRCAGLTVIVTSREPLGIAGELTYRVPSLSVPKARHDTTREEAMAFEATRLFVERARLQRPDFDVTDRDAAWRRRACARCRWKS
jgi:DNA-binding winged helix-turn-helix (wHTH) protein